MRAWRRRRSGDIGEQTEAPMTEEERRRAVREKQNRNLRTTAQMTEKERREFARIGGQASAKARKKEKRPSGTAGGASFQPCDA